METRHLVKLSYYIQKQWIETRKITINQIESACSLFWGVSTFCQYKTDQRVDYRWIGRVFLKIRNITVGIAIEQVSRNIIRLSL